MKQVKQHAILIQRFGFCSSYFAKIKKINKQTQDTGTNAVVQLSLTYWGGLYKNGDAPLPAASNQQLLSK